MKRAMLGVLLCAVAVNEAAAQRIQLPMSVKDMEAASAADPNDVMARYNLALGYWTQKKYDDSEANLKDAISIEPRFALAWLALAVLPFAQREDLWNETLEERIPVEWRDRMIESDRQYRTAFMLNPLLDTKIVGAITPRKSVLWSMDSYYAAMYDEWFRGFDDFQTGDYAGAFLRLQRLARDLTAAGRQNVRNVPTGLLWYRGLAAAHIVNWDASIEDLRELLRRAEEEEDPSRLTYLPLEANTYRSVLATVLRAAGRNDEAAAMFTEVLERDAGAYTAHIALADMAEARGDLHAALLARQAASAANPDDFSTDVEIGITLVRLDRVAEAEEVLNRVAAVQPRSPRAWYVLGLIQQQTGRPEEARTSLEKFLETVPSRFTREIADAKQRLSTLGS
jgi:tetratricopeptide (TPR) repeat protein